MTICRNDLKQISTLDRQIKSYSTSASNPLVRSEGGRGRERRGREGGGRGTIINNSLKWKRVESLVYFLQVHMVYIGKS